MGCGGSGDVCGLRVRVFLCVRACALALVFFPDAALVMAAPWSKPRRCAPTPPSRRPTFAPASGRHAGERADNAARPCCRLLVWVLGVCVCGWVGGWVGACACARARACVRAGGRCSSQPVATGRPSWQRRTSSCSTACRCSLAITETEPPPPPRRRRRAAEAPGAFLSAGGWARGWRDPAPRSESATVGGAAAAAGGVDSLRSAAPAAGRECT